MAGVGVAGRGGVLEGRRAAVFRTTRPSSPCLYSVANQYEVGHSSAGGAARGCDDVRVQNYATQFTVSVADQYEAGARFTKYLTIYRKIIVSLS